MEPATAAVSLAARTVHMRIHPTPRTFSERREVLRVLEQFGEVTMFRSLKYHPRTPVPNAFLSIFHDEQAAKKIINTSPIRFRILPGPESSEATLPSTDQTGTRIKSDGPTEERIFELKASHSKFDHQTHIASQPLYGPFRPVHPKYSYIASLLHREIAPSLWSKGMGDWETDSLRWTKPAVNTKDEERSELRSGGDRAIAGREVRARLQRRKMSDLPSVMKGLKALSEQRLDFEALSQKGEGVTENGEKIEGASEGNA